MLTHPERAQHQEKEVSMSGSLNKATLIGHLGKDPEIRTFKNGGRAANFSVATSESWKDKDSGEKKERTEWHYVSILSDGLVGIAEKYLKKGSRVYLQGQLETRKWTDRGGIERYNTEVVLRPYSGELILLDRNKDAKPSSDDAPDSENEGADAGEVETGEAEDEAPAEAQRAGLAG
jgi:single-strand DNA-binding protein